MALKEAIVGGTTITRNGDFDAKMNSNSHGKIVAITFLNQGRNSTATIRVGGGADIILTSGGKDKYGNYTRQGASYTILMPTGYFDTTTYTFRFTDGGDGGTQVNELLITYIKANDLA